jgi:putative ABC transport system permease protein
MQAAHPEIAEITAVASFKVKVKGDFKTSGDILNVDSPHFIGVDPATFSRLVELEYFQGDPQTAVKKLSEGGHIFVTKDFHLVRNLGVGDKLTIMDHKNHPVEFTIAAVVTSTGMELVKNYFDMRSMFHDHALTSMLGSLSDARKYFRNRTATVLLANLKPGITPEQLGAFKQALMQEGYPAVSSVELKSSVLNLITRVVDALSILAIAALAVASLGVANMVIASVHARRFEFGVLRAIGAGRGQLVRLVLAEVTLIGVVAGVLGAAAGLYLTFMATRVDELMFGFDSKYLALDLGTAAGSIALHLVVAMLLTTLLAWLASIGPAARGAFTAQRTLLASGRG